jgi:hypothetical protein
MSAARYIIPQVNPLTFIFKSLLHLKRKFERLKSIGIEPILSTRFIGSAPHIDPQIEDAYNKQHKGNREYLQRHEYISR